MKKKKKMEKEMREKEKKTQEITYAYENSSTYTLKETDDANKKQTNNLIAS